MVEEVLGSMRERNSGHFWTNLRKISNQKKKVYEKFRKSRVFIYKIFFSYSDAIKNIFLLQKAFPSALITYCVTDIVEFCMPWILIGFLVPCVLASSQLQQLF